MMFFRVSPIRLLGFLGVTILFLGFCTIPLLARTPQLPEWFRFSASLAEIPQIDQPVQLVASLAAPAGEIRDIRVALILPPGWTSDRMEDRLESLPAGGEHVFRFQVKAAGALPNGGIGCSFEARVPKTTLIEKVRKEGGPLSEAMAKAIGEMSDIGTGYADVAFALFPEEGFYPLGDAMWLAYDDRIKPSEAIRGPSLWRDDLISLHQAENDVEMFDRLKAQLAANPALGDQLKKNGIDLARKRGDAGYALVVLATEAFLKGEFPRCLQLLGHFEAEIATVPADQLTDLRIAQRNLRALCLWSSGDKRGAENLLRDTFYQNRKLPVQRYVLRNLGLLTLDKKDQNTAREMFRLALDIKPGYSLLQKELSQLQKK